MTAPAMAAASVAARTRARGVGGAAHQHAVHPLHHAPEGLVLLEEAQHDRVPLEDARHAAALDREVDHLGDQAPRALATRDRSASADVTAASRPASTTSATASTISSLVLYWW